MSDGLEWFEGGACMVNDEIVVEGDDIVSSFNGVTPSGIPFQIAVVALLQKFKVVSILNQHFDLSARIVVPPLSSCLVPSSATIR